MRIAAVLVVGLSFVSLARAGELAGVVFRDDGEPAAGATVNAAAVFHSPPARFSTQTDDLGMFHFDLPPLPDSEFYYLAVRWRSQGTEFWKAVGADAKPADIQGQELPLQSIRLHAAGRLRGKVLLAETGEPAPGARLFFDTGEIITTDDQGGFEIDGLSMQDHTVIPVAPGRLRPYVLFDTTNRPDAELELRVAKGAIVKGRITDAAGEPIKDAYVRRASSGRALALNGWDELCLPDGTFEYGGLSPQRLFYDLTVVAPGYQPGSLETEVQTVNDVIVSDVRLEKSSPASATPESSALPVAAERPVAAELPRRTIEGTVRGGGGAIEGASVRWVRSIWDGSVETVKSDTSGGYSLKRVPEGQGALLVIAGGFAPQFAAVSGGDTEIDVSLSAGATVRGVVRGSSGKPVAGARVVPLVHCLASGIWNPIWLDERAAETNDEGEFEVREAPSVGVVFDILKPGFSGLRNLTLQQGGILNEIVLTAGGALSGIVVDERNRPVRDFNVRVQFPRKRVPGENYGGYYAGFNWYGITFTRNDGVFVFTGMPANNWMRLVVSSPGVGRGIIDRIQAKALDELPDPQTQIIRLTPFEPLAVHVSDAVSGKPIADAAVGLLEDELFAARNFSWGYDDLWNSRARSDAGGVARFQEPACEDGVVTVTAPGYGRRRIEWTDGSPELAVALEPEARLEGVALLKGQPLGEGSARLQSADGDTFSADLDGAAGRFVFDRLPAGEFELTIRGTNGQSLHQSKLPLTAGAPATIEVDLLRIDNKNEK